MPHDILLKAGLATCLLVCALLVMAPIATASCHYCKTKDAHASIRLGGSIVCTAGVCVGVHGASGLCAVAGKTPTDTWTCAGRDGVCSRTHSAGGTWQELCIFRSYGGKAGVFCASSNLDPKGNCFVPLS